MIWLKSTVIGFVMAIATIVAIVVATTTWHMDAVKARRDRRGVVWSISTAALPRRARVCARVSMDVSPPAAARKIAQEHIVSEGNAWTSDTLRLASTKSWRLKWPLKIAAEVALISVGVFLALMAQQWREQTHARELARDSLQRFRVELVRNRKSIEAVKDHHKSLRDGLQRYLAADPNERDRQAVQVRGLQPATFERTAWDLALATQSLANIDSHLAFELSRIYGLQTRYDDQTRSMLHAIYIRPVGENMEALFYYYGDAVLWDTALLQLYKNILPQLDEALRQ